MNNIVSFTRPDGLVMPPAAAWAVAQLIVMNELHPDEVWRAVRMYSESVMADEDDL